eukprot:symbB.v1.2.002375.t1/scaffold110.1/size325157/22
MVRARWFGAVIGFAFKVVQFGYLKYDSEQLQKSLDDLKRTELGTELVKEVPIDREAELPATLDMDIAGDDGWGDFGLDDVRQTTPQQPAPQPEAEPAATLDVDIPGDDGWGDFGLDDVRQTTPQPEAGEKPEQDADAWGIADLDLGPTAVGFQAGKQQLVEQLSAASSRVVELEKELQMAANDSAKAFAQVDQLQQEMEQKLEETTTKNQTLQEQLDALTAEKSQASENQLLDRAINKWQKTI